MAQSSNLFGFFLEAAKDTGASAAETVASFAGTLTTALTKATTELLPARNVITSVVIAVEKLTAPTISSIIEETDLPVDDVASALQTAETVGLIRRDVVGDSIHYVATNEGKKLLPK